MTSGFRIQPAVRQYCEIMADSVLQIAGANVGLFVCKNFREVSKTVRPLLFHARTPVISSQLVDWKATVSAISHTLTYTMRVTHLVAHYTIKIATQAAPLTLAGFATAKVFELISSSHHKAWKTVKYTAITLTVFATGYFLKAPVLYSMIAAEVVVVHHEPVVMAWIRAHIWTSQGGS